MHSALRKRSRKRLKADLQSVKSRKTLIEAGEKRLSEAEEYINALMAKNADLNNEILALGNDRDEARIRRGDNCTRARVAIKN